MPAIGIEILTIDSGARGSRWYNRYSRDDRRFMSLTDSWHDRHTKHQLRSGEHRFLRYCQLKIGYARSTHEIPLNSAYHLA